MVVKKSAWCAVDSILMQLFECGGLKVYPSGIRYASTLGISLLHSSFKLYKIKRDNLATNTVTFKPK